MTHRAAFALVAVVLNAMLGVAAYLLVNHVSAVGPGAGRLLAQVAFVALNGLVVYAYGSCCGGELRRADVVAEPARTPIAGSSTPAAGPATLATR